MIKRKKKNDETETNSWITTFTNLMILLLAFFIVLVNLAVVDNRKKQAALNSLFGSFGFHSGGQSAIGENTGSDITMADSPMVKGEIYLEQLQNIAIANGLGSDIMVNKEPEKTVITLNNKVLFDRGSYIIPQESINFLSDLSNYLKKGTGLIELRGYADQAETLDEPDPSSTSLFLSTKRALAVLHFLAESGEIPISRIVAHGFGIPPKERKYLKEISDWQRQVDIIVSDREMIPYRLRVSRQGDRVFDFKGFLFERFRPKNQ